MTPREYLKNGKGEVKIGRCLVLTIAGGSGCRLWILSVIYWIHGYTKVRNNSLILLAYFWFLFYWQPKRFFADLCCFVLPGSNFLWFDINIFVKNSPCYKFDKGKYLIILEVFSFEIFFAGKIHWPWRTF